jgi:membrane protein DedA with SNARE-associated domain
LPSEKLEKFYKVFERWGFGAIAIPAMLPPPAPMVPFVLAAGAMQYSVTKFVAAMTLGRIVRYSILAYLAARYGRHILRLISQVGHPILICTIALIAAAAAVLIAILASKRRKSARA